MFPYFGTLFVITAVFELFHHVEELDIIFVGSVVSLEGAQGLVTDSIV
jgi:hypothetical protein